jgi:hypothetical protein
MIGKKQLKTELQLPTVAIIGEILKAAGRDPKGQNVEDADAELVRSAVVYWRKGHSYAEAVRLAKAALAEQAGGQEEATNQTNGNGTLTLQNRVQHQQAKLAQQKRQTNRQATVTRATTDAVENETLYWLALAAAEASPQVQESAPVTQARDLYFQLRSGQLSQDEAINQMGDQLENLGFFEDENLLEGFLPVEADISDSETPVELTN